MKPFRFSLIFAILASLACLLGLTWVLLSLISFKTAEKDLLASKSEQGHVLLAAFVNLLPPPSMNLAGSAAARFAEGLAREGDFAGITVVDSAGRPLYQLGEGGASDQGIAECLKTGVEVQAFSPDRSLVSRYAPIVSNGRVVGACRLSLSLSAEHARLTRSRHIFLAYFFLDFLLLLGFGAFLLSRAVVVPIRRLLAATERIAAGDYAHPVHVPGSAEIALLAESFNDMLETLRSKDEAVATYVRSLEKANEELKSAREETIRTEKMASLGLLAAGMAHEIGTPLAAIMGYAGILHEELGSDAEKADYLRRIEDDCARIDRMVRSLLDYARPAPARNEPVELARLVAASAELLAGQGVFKRVDLVLDLGEDLPPVTADRHQLQQALINLMINARDAMPSGGRLVLRLTRESAGSDSARQWLRLEVTDSGEGIAPELLPKVFEPFFTTKQPGKGTGLGLAIVARVIEACGGRIDVTSVEGEGTTFTVLLPAAGAGSDRQRGWG